MADHSKDGFGMLYEATYCRALNNLAKKTSARSERLWANCQIFSNMMQCYPSVEMIVETRK